MTLTKLNLPAISNILGIRAREGSGGGGGGALHSPLVYLYCQNIIKIYNLQNINNNISYLF